MLTGHDVICISSIDWDFIWQGHQQIMSTLAAHGNRVLFIENTGVRPPRLSDLPRLRSRIARWWRSTAGFREERKHLYVLSPLLLPLPYSRLALLINRRLLLGAIRRWMRVRFGAPRFEDLGLPGGELIDSGLASLAAGEESLESLVVSLAAPRLRREGVPLPALEIPDADMRLFRLLEQMSGDLAHARYLAYLRQATSFADACSAARVS